MRLLDTLLFVAVFLFVSTLSGRLHAYLDPGTGSMMIQLLLGGVVGVIATVKLYWRQLKGFMGRRTDDASDPGRD